MTIKENQQELRADSTAERNDSGFSGQRGQYQDAELHRREEPQTLMRFSEQGRRDLAEWQSNGSNGVLSDDRIRKALARSTGADAERANSTTERFKTDVREYTAGNAERQTSIQELVREYQRSRQDTEQQYRQIIAASEQLERASAELRTASHTLEEVRREQQKNSNEWSRW